MVLIADSGSTKTHWCVIENTSIIKNIFTKGINPFYQSEDEIALEIELNLLPKSFFMVPVVRFLKRKPW